MEQGELQQLDTLLHQLRHDKHIMEGLSVQEQQQISGASETIRSLIRKRLKAPESDAGKDLE
jgi:hypothetical protein